MTTPKKKSNSSYKDAAMTILLSGEALKQISTAPLPICGLEVCSFWRLPHASWESMSDHLDPANSRSVAKLLLETIILSTLMEKIRINLTAGIWTRDLLVDPQTNQALEKEQFSMITS